MEEIYKVCFFETTNIDLNLWKHRANQGLVHFLSVYFMMIYTFTVFFKEQDSNINF